MFKLINIIVFCKYIMILNTNCFVLKVKFFHILTYIRLQLVNSRVSIVVFCAS